MTVFLYRYRFRSPEGGDWTDTDYAKTLFSILEERPVPGSRAYRRGR